MLVFDNIIFELQKAGGVSVYWYELLCRAQLSKVSKAAFYGRKSENILAGALDSSFKAEGNFLPLSIRRYLPFLKKVSVPHIFHSSYYRVNLSKYAANVTTVHDYTYEYYMQGLRKNVHSFQKDFAIRFSDGVICVSENTKNDLVKFNPSVDQSKVRVIYNGVSEQFRPLPLNNHIPLTTYEGLAAGRFVLFVGDRSHYKNFDKAVLALSEFPELQLCVVGGKEFNEQEIAMLTRLRGRVFHYRGISSESLNLLYNNAFCLLYPSDYEGFGIPILEAMKAGCPVVSTNKSSIPEVAGNAALLVNDTNASSFAEQISKLKDVKLRSNLIDKGFSQASKFSWDKCFEQTFSFYQEVYKRKFG